LMPTCDSLQAIQAIIVQSSKGYFRMLQNDGITM